MTNKPILGTDNLTFRRERGGGHVFFQRQFFSHETTIRLFILFSFQVNLHDSIKFAKGNFVFLKIYISRPSKTLLVVSLIIYALRCNLNIFYCLNNDKRSDTSFST
jgi:hypothetical protein